LRCFVCEHREHPDRVPVAPTVAQGHVLLLTLCHQSFSSRGPKLRPGPVAGVTRQSDLLCSEGGVLIARPMASEFKARVTWRSNRRSCCHFFPLKSRAGTRISGLKTRYERRCPCSDISCLWGACCSACSF
jgi:hypothetical protein